MTPLGYRERPFVTPRPQYLWLFVDRVGRLQAFNPGEPAVFTSRAELVRYARNHNLRARWKRVRFPDGEGRGV